MRRALAVFMLFGFTACEVGPDYHKPDLPTPPAYAELSAQAPLSVPQASEADLSQWWTQFGDATLQSLIAQALHGNLDLQIAASRVREARQQVIIAGAAELPQVNASGTAARLHSGSNLMSKLGGSSGATPATGGTDIKLYSVGFDASWEIDVFGGTRRAIEAAAAGSEAAVWQMHDGEVSLTAEIASDYCALRAGQARVQVLQYEIAQQNALLALTTAKRRAGFVTELDVNAVRTQVAAAQAQVPALQAQARAAEHAIAVLMGKQPEDLTALLDPPTAVPSPPATLPVGLPSDLLRRRPDIRAAERQLAAASAQIGVATADLYPKFNLLAGVSFTSNHLSNLFSTSNLGEFGLGSIMWPIFNGGRIDANISVKQEEANQAYLTYKKTVLAAVQETEDAIDRYAASQQALVTLRQSVDSAQSSAVLSQAQYKAGLVPYLNVLTAQATAQQQRDQLVQAEQAYAQNLVALYKALGGGWQPDAPTAP
ncbi:MAG TPA: efflux transporter outer membrane subunit [Rhizomicrobium sp.]|jgi:NodT family efflux transporter outer membrane factor (OMF) lipoprotein|nr:efflux transporter outer membrane subunit [Rhizomicrobium sp.]